ncbi:hypothetical protein ACUTAF_06015 [Pseudomonas sp. SP16.1]|uniref:hypothetical protein n=1 Tax=Pseudomonas sp. SP16.1 TaxID=3458854 RepID=UPI004045BEDA
MFQQLSPIEKIAVLVVSSCMAVFALLVCLSLTLAPAYSDFIVGNTAWYASTKAQDLLAAPVFILMLLSGLWFFTGQISRAKAKCGDETADALVSQLLWWSVPVVATLGGSLIGLPLDKKLFYISAVGLVYLTLVSAAIVYGGRRINPTVAGLGLLSVLLIALLPLEVALVKGRLPADWVYEFELGRYLKTTYMLIGLGFVLMLIGIVVYAERFERVLPRLLLVGQLGLPLLFLCFYPARLLTPEGALTKYSTTPALKILLAAMVVWGLIDVARRYFTFMRCPQANWSALLSPVALFALLMAVKAGATVAPQVNPDDYHFGEHLLGWWSYLQGVIPYVGYMPAHGIIGDDLPGMLAYFFYDGKASSVVEASRLATLLLALFAFLALHRYSGSVGLAFVSISFLGGFSQSTNLNWLFLAPFICLWLYPGLLAKPAKWLGIWIVTVPLVILGVPPQGLLLVAASGLAALYMVWRYWQVGDIWHGRKEIGLALAVLLLMAIVSPLVPMLFNAIRYVLENGPINQVAYGIPWKLSWNAGARSGFIFELVRMSWIMVPVLCAVLLYTQRNNPAISRSLLLPALIVLVFSLLLIPYSMGRIDPGAGSRPAVVGILGWAILLPIALWGLLKQRDKAAWVLLVVGMSASLNAFPPSLSVFVSSLSARIPVGPLRDGASVGLPNLGVGTVQDEHWGRLTRLNALLSRKLAPGENYLDLTSRNAQYFYLDRMPEQVVTAPYNMVPLAQQRRAIERLAQELPRIALLEGNNITHDGGGLALRNPLLYRFVLQNYVPSLEDGFIIGYRKTDISAQDNTLSMPLMNLTDDNWNQGVNRRDSALVLADSALASLLVPGQSVRLASGEFRTVARVWEQGSAIWLDGSVLDPATVGAPKTIEASINPQGLSTYRAALLQRAFAVIDYEKIPVAWGRSEKLLLHKMERVAALSSRTPLIRDLSLEDNVYKVVGPDPQINFDLSDLKLSGHDAGLLRFKFSCLDRSQDSKMQVFWWGDSESGPSEASSVRFALEDGVLIVPLDAAPRWLTLGQVHGLRLDLDDAAACSGIRFEEAALYQRTAIK